VKITLESTSQLSTINGVPARVWEGQTDSGIAVIAWVSRIAVREDQDQSQFLKELAEQRPPSADAQSFPLRMIL